LQAGTSHITYRSSRLQSLTTIPDLPPSKIGHGILVPYSFPIQADLNTPEEHSPRIDEASGISECLNSASLQPCCSQAHLANLLDTLFVKSLYGVLLHPHWGHDGKRWSGHLDCDLKMVAEETEGETVTVSTLVSVSTIKKFSIETSVVEVVIISITTLVVS
jgi:hypothetical protein